MTARKPDADGQTPDQTHRPPFTSHVGITDRAQSDESGSDPHAALIAELRALYSGDEWSDAHIRAADALVQEKARADEAEREAQLARENYSKQAQKQKARAEAAEKDRDEFASDLEKTDSTCWELWERTKKAEARADRLAAIVRNGTDWHALTQAEAEGLL